MWCLHTTKNAENSGIHFAAIFDWPFVLYSSQVIAGSSILRTIHCIWLTNTPIIAHYKLSLNGCVVFVLFNDCSVYMWAVECPCASPTELMKFWCCGNAFCLWVGVISIRGRHWSISAYCISRIHFGQIEASVTMGSCCQLGVHFWGHSSTVLGIAWCSKSGFSRLHGVTETWSAVLNSLRQNSLSVTPRSDRWTFGQAERLVCHPFPPSLVQLLARGGMSVVSHDSMPFDLFSSHP